MRVGLITIFAANWLFSCRTAHAPQQMQLFGEGSPTLTACLGDRQMLSGDEAFHFKATDMTLGNAYWMAVVAANTYSKKDVLLAEMKRLGFSDDSSPESQNHLAFMDQDGVIQSGLFANTGFRYANTQALWAENRDFVILSFRGTEVSDWADIITDLWLTQKNLIPTEEEVIGTIPSSEAPQSEFPTPGSRDIRLHKGFLYALEIVWKDIEQRARLILNREQKNEQTQKMALLDNLATKAPHQLDTALNAVTDWHIELAGKRNFIRQWKLISSDAQQRSDLYHVINRRWTPWMKPVWLTGHSLGGALAAITAYRFLKMGLRVQGLYTYGSPRPGNHAFAHELRALAFDRGLKIAKGEGNLARFVSHMDIVPRIPPLFGWTSVIDESNLNPILDRWDHVSKMRYLTGSETEAAELWAVGREADEESLAAHRIPNYTVSLPLERWKQWGGDHRTHSYFSKLEKLAFGTQTNCPP